MKPLNLNLKKIEKSFFQFVLGCLILTVCITTNSLPAFAQTANSSSDAGDNTVWYALVGFAAIALIAVIALRIRKKPEPKAEDDAEAAKRGAVADKNVKTDEKSETNSVKKSNNGAQQSGETNGSRQSGNGSVKTKLKAINYTDEFEEFKTKQTQNLPATNGTNGSSNSNGSISWQLSQPTPFEALPSSEDDAVLDAVEQIFADDGDNTMRSLAIRVLSVSKTAESVEGLQHVALYDDSAKLKIEALMALGSFDHESVFEPILLACADSSREVRAAAARMLTRLTFDRADAFVRIIGSRDAERMSLASRACVESGFASRAFERLSAQDPKQSYEAFAILTLLVKAGEVQPIVETVAEHPNLQVRLATIKILHSLNPQALAPALYEISTKVGVPAEVKKALGELLFHLNTAA